MPGGPIFPFSAQPITGGKVFPNCFVLRNPIDTSVEGLGVMASLDGDAVWQLYFLMPGTLPSGTCKLRLLAIAGDNSHDAKVDPKWMSLAPGELLDDAVPATEGTQTLSWGATDSGKFKELKVTLDADTVVAGEIIVMNLTFITASWTLAAVSTWIASIIWE